MTIQSVKGVEAAEEWLHGGGTLHNDTVLDLCKLARTGAESADRISALEAALKPFADKVTSLDASKKLFDPDYGQTKDILYAGEDAYRRAKAALEGK